MWTLITSLFGRETCDWNLERLLRVNFLPMLPRLNRVAVTYQWIGSTAIAAQNRTTAFFARAHIHADGIRRATSAGTARIRERTALRVVVRIAGNVGKIEFCLGAVEAWVGVLKLGRR